MLVSVVLAIGVERVAYRPLRNAPTPRPADQRHRRVVLPAVHVPRVLRLRHLRLSDAGLPASSRRPIPLLSMRWVDVLVIVASLAMMAGLYLFVHAVADRHRDPGRVRGQGHGRPHGHRRNRAIVLTFVIGAAMAGAAGVLYGLSSAR